MKARVDHVAIFVRDLEGIKEFYRTYFGAEANELYHNPRTGLRTYFLSFDGEARIEIMSRPDMNEDAAPSARGWHHVALSLGSKEAVDDLVARLSADGVEVSPPRTTGDGYYEAVVIDPEGNHIEITA